MFSMFNPTAGRSRSRPLRTPRAKNSKAVVRNEMNKTRRLIRAMEGDPISIILASSKSTGQQNEELKKNFALMNSEQLTKTLSEYMNDPVFSVRLSKLAQSALNEKKQNFKTNINRIIGTNRNLSSNKLRKIFQILIDSKNSSLDNIGSLYNTNLRSQILPVLKLIMLMRLSNDKESLYKYTKKLNESEMIWILTAQMNDIVDIDNKNEMSKYKQVTDMITYVMKVNSILTNELSANENFYNMVERFSKSNYRSRVNNSGIVTNRAVSNRMGLSENGKIRPWSWASSYKTHRPNENMSRYKVVPFHEK